MEWIMKHKILLIVGLLLFGGAVAYCNTDLYPINAKFNVVDETGSPIADATVRIGFIKKAKAWETAETGTMEVQTGKDGKVDVLIRTQINAEGRAKKDGYYDKRFERIDYSTEANKAGIPYGLPVSVERTIVLRKVLNPESLVSVRLKDYWISALDKKIGFDLEASDWVSPYGKGKTADFYIKQKGYYNNYNDYNYQFVLSFPNEGDGIVAFNASTDEWRFAPENGYKSSFEWKSMRKIDEDHREERNGFNQDYFLRVRTELDEDGKVLKANYARIQRQTEIQPIDPDKELFTRITLYYRFNSRVNSRSLESGGENGYFF